MSECEHEWRVWNQSEAWCPKCQGSTSLNGLLRDLAAAQERERVMREAVTTPQMIAARMRTQYPRNQHAREWADWIEREDWRATDCERCGSPRIHCCCSFGASPAPTPRKMHGQACMTDTIDRSDGPAPAPSAEPTTLTCCDRCRYKDGLACGNPACGCHVIDAPPLEPTQALDVEAQCTDDWRTHDWAPRGGGTVDCARCGKWVGDVLKAAAPPAGELTAEDAKALLVAIDSPWRWDGKERVREKLRALASKAGGQ